MSNKPNIKYFFLLAGLFILSFTFSCTNAANPLALHIEVNTVLNEPFNPFYATGPAVEDGRICSTGKVGAEQGAEGSHHEVPEGVTEITLNINKHFYCADGSGNFKIDMTVTVDTSGMKPSTAQWTLVGTEGKYLHLTGNGTLTGVASADGESVYDVYDGTVP